MTLSRFFHFSNLWFGDGIYLPSIVVIGNNINHVFGSNLHTVNSFLGEGNQVNSNINTAPENCQNAFVSFISFVPYNNMKWYR